MRRIIDIVSDHPAPADDRISLDHDLRTRRRMVLTTEAGAAILLDQPRPAHMRDGDRLLLEDGATVHVEAAAEPLLEITAPDLPALVRIAWHLGNRHLPTQLLWGRLRIRNDHVIAQMAQGLGGRCEHVLAAFDPEGGAYAHGEDTGHGHHHHGHKIDDGHAAGGAGHGPAHHAHPHEHERRSQGHGADGNHHHHDHGADAQHTHATGTHHHHGHSQAHAHD